MRLRLTVSAFRHGRTAALCAGFRTQCRMPGAWPQTRPVPTSVLPPPSRQLGAALDGVRLPRRRTGTRPLSVSVDGVGRPRLSRDVLQCLLTAFERVLIVWCVAGGFSIDALKKEAESLMIPEEKQMYYVAAQIVQLKEAEKRHELERKEAEKRLGLERLELERQSAIQRKEAEKQLELELERKEAEKQLELERKEAEKRLELERLKMEITKTGLLWKLRTQTQRHALELFLFNCWERFQKCSGPEIEQIRSKIQKFPTKPTDVKVSVASWDVLVTWCILPSVTLTRETSWQEPDKSMLQQVIGLDIPICNRIREDLLGGAVFPRLSANVMYGVLSQRLHQSDAGRDLYVGDDEGDAVIKFYETLARRYGYTMTKLKRDYQVAYSEMLGSGG